MVVTILQIRDSKRYDGIFQEVETSFPYKSQNILNLEIEHFCLLTGLN